MNHTPGPWRAGKWMEDDSTGIVYGSAGEPVAIVRNVREEGPANQALIASAPDLLAERDRLLLQIGEMQGHLEDLADMYGERTTLMLTMHDALQNMTGLFGEASTRLAMGKAFTDLHGEAVKSAKAALTELQKETGKKEKRNDKTACICPPEVKCPVHPKHCDCKFHGIFVEGVCDQCGLRE